MKVLLFVLDMSVCPSAKISGLAHGGPILA